MREIITAIQNWNRIKIDAAALQDLFDNKRGFVLNYGLFPSDSPLHAYAAIKNNVFGFYIIAESDDVKSDDATLAKNIHWHPCISVLQEDQKITEKEALLRIDDWEKLRNEWIDAKIKLDGALYQSFYIPTTDLHDERYMVYFGLKNHASKALLKDADLVLKNQSNLYFDTIRLQPPYPIKMEAYYLLELV